MRHVESRIRSMPTENIDPEGCRLMFISVLALAVQDLNEDKFRSAALLFFESGDLDRIALLAGRSEWVTSMRRFASSYPILNNQV